MRLTSGTYNGATCSLCTLANIRKKTAPGATRIARPAAESDCTGRRKTIYLKIALRWLPSSNATPATGDEL